MSPFIANALRNFAAAALGVGLSCTASAATAAEPSKFAPPGLQPEAVRYEALLKTTIKPAKKSAREWTAEATKAMAGAAPDPRVATQNYSQAVVADPTDAGAWTGLSRALLAIKVEANSGSERYELPLHASAAAWIAYDRAKTAEL